MSFSHNPVIYAAAVEQEPPRVRVSVVQCRGTPYEIGQQQGRIFAGSKRVLVAVGGDASLVPGTAVGVDFEAWVAGASLPVAELTGILGGVAQPGVRSEAFKKHARNR